MKHSIFNHVKNASLITLCLMTFSACGEEELNDNKIPDEQEQKEGEEPTDQEQEPKDITLTPESWYETNYWERTDREKMGLRGKVKKWYFNTYYYTEYEFDEAGHLTLSREIDPDSRFPERCTWYTYDSQGRLIKKVYARVTEKGGSEIDKWSGVQTTEYAYGNGEKYVWVEPQNMDSRGFVNYLGPDMRNPLNNLMKGLSTVSDTHVIGTQSGSCTLSTYTFDEGGALVVTTEHFTIDEEGNRVDDDNSYSYTYNPITYRGNYPYAFELISSQAITSMTWRDNGMPLTVDGTSGLTEYSTTEKRYINPVKWTCKEGNPIDALFGFIFAREWTYDSHTGELTQLLEWNNQESDRPWTRPSKWEYTYDSHGNWTSYKEEYMILADGPDGDVQTGTISRTIEYY